jgi:hypothetical protein
MSAKTSATEASNADNRRERLTWAKICKRYPDEWVVVTAIDHRRDRGFVFRSALVLGHFKRRKDASERVKAAFERFNSVGSFWTGKIRGPIPRFIIP